MQRRAEAQEAGAHRDTLVLEGVATGVHVADRLATVSGAPGVLTTISGIDALQAYKGHRAKAVSWALHPRRPELDWAP